ncbi:AMP-binding protein [Paenibacillus ferrarius]|uniref:AMP-binding protein n=1 Tax=Paenibacillus ferrarius TaxID=1469647 RepID=UPI003D2B36C0
MPSSWMDTVRSIKKYFPWYPLDASEMEGLLQMEGHGLTQLPLMSAKLLENHYYTDANPLLARTDLNRYRTSGTSSNRRKTILYSQADEEAYLRIKLNVFQSVLGPGSYRTALADMGTGHAEATAVEVFRELGMNVESVSFQLPIEAHLERLSSMKPEVLYTMPSILDRILAAADDPKAFGIRHVLLVGEIASRGWRQRAAERLGLSEREITDTYGSIEIGTIAYFSHEHTRYLFADGIVAEGIPAEELEGDLETLPDGEQVLVLTSTVREAFPALRFVTYDVVRDLRPIEVDGVLRQSFASIVKRIGPDLKHGEKISIYDIEDVVCRHLGDASVRVQVAGNGLKVHVYSPLATLDVLGAIRHDLENHIPAIGLMIRSRILDGIEVLRGTLDDAQTRASVKNKKIFYT